MKKNILNYLFIILMLNLTYAVNSQSIINWQKCLGGSNSEPNFGDVSTKILKTHDNSFIIITGTNSNDGDVNNISEDNYGDIWIVKIDSLGNQLWSNCIGGDDYDFPYSVSETTDSCFIVMGSTNSTNISNSHNGGDLLLSKMNNNGTILWQKCFGGYRNDSDAKNHNGIYGNSNYAPQHLLEKSNGNLVIIAETLSSDGDVIGLHDSANPAYDIWLFEIDVNGNIIRQKCLGGTDFDIPIEIKPNYNNSEYLILGVTNSNDGDITNGSGGLDFVLFKVDSLFNIVWTHVFGTASDDIPSSIVIENDGDIMVMGMYDGQNTGQDGQIVIYKIDNNGNIIFSNNFGGSLSEGLNTILHPTNDNGYVFGTTSRSNDGDINLNFGVGDYWVVKIDSLGNIVWDEVLGSIYDDYDKIYISTNNYGEVLVAIGVVDTSGNLFNSNYNGWYDIGILKFDINGNLLSYNCIGGSSFDIPSDIIYDSENDSYTILGWTQSNDGDINNNHGNNDLWIVSLNSNILNSISPIEMESEISIYPNPFDNYINVDLSYVNANSPVNLIVYNSLGLIVENIMIKEPKSTIQLNNNFAKDVYLFRITDQTGKTLGALKLLCK